MTDFNVKFVSKKISRVRWRPRADVKSSASTIFATGSWDDQVRLNQKEKPGG